MSEQPADPVAAMNTMLAQVIPVAHRMGVTFTELQPGRVSATVPFEGNGNHFGVVYAGVTFTVAEVLGGAMFWATFEPGTHFPLVKNLAIEFLAPGTGPLRATARLEQDEIARMRAELATGAKVPFVLEAEVSGDDGTVVARTRGDYQLRPIGR